MTAPTEIFVDAGLRFACAAEVNLPNEKLVFTELDVAGGYVSFQMMGVSFFGRVNKAGTKLKKGSVRQDRN